MELDSQIINHGKGEKTMTEKRYIFDPSIGHFTDTKTDKIYCEYNLDEVVDMLNKYEKENQQLKKREHEIKKIINNLETKEK